jgi:two-component system response regulator PilR (NtrC family)
VASLKGDDESRILQNWTLALASGTWQTAKSAGRARDSAFWSRDDERSMRELLAIVLKREGYEVIVAENGQAALDVLAKGAVDLVISDIKMPDMSGVEVLRAAKAADASLPAIMMTAFASTETAVEAMRLGACDYLIKPFDVDELKLKVREKVEARQLRQENVLLKRALNQPHVMAGIIGRSSTMLAVFDLIESGGQDHQHRSS